MDLAETYLTQYGYMRRSSSKVGALRKLDQAISKFQEFAGLEVTGELNQETVTMMEMPRCGVKDFMDGDEDADTPRIKVNGVLSRKKVELFSYCYFMAKFNYCSGTCCKGPGGG